jgi:hypothetical protein
VVRVCVALVLLAALLPAQVSAGAVGAGVGNIPQGIQSDAAYSASFVGHQVTNVFATTQRVSCYRPEVPYSVSNGPTDGYSGESPCNGAPRRARMSAPHLPNTGRQQSRLSGQDAAAGQEPLRV